jgi:amino acid transporter
VSSCHVSYRDPSYSNTGWLCAITWQSGVSGNAYVAGTLIQGLFVLNIKSYDYKQWHGSLLTLLMLLIAVIFNTLLARRLPMVEGIFVFAHIIGILIFIPIWVLSPRREGGSPLTEFYNPGGWSSEGLATMIGTVGPLAALMGFDCSVHMGMLIR